MYILRHQGLHITEGDPTLIIVEIQSVARYVKALT